MPETILDVDLYPHDTNSFKDVVCYVCVVLKITAVY